LLSTSTTQSAWTLRTSSRAIANGGTPAIDRNAPASARRKRSIGASPVVPWMRLSATSRIQPSRWASNPDQLSKRRPANRELGRFAVLRDLDQRRLTTPAAAQLLGLERRQVFRLLKA
jgi:hypothetical protein